jgi:magnesium chelatase subunit I
MAPLCAACRGRAREAGTTPPGRVAGPDQRYVRSSRRPDVTIADMIGDLDPIKAARASLELSDELTMHYGWCRAPNRGIFAINELPDLAGKIQSALQHPPGRDVQIKGYPVPCRST